MSRKEDFIEAGIQNHIHHCPQMMLRGGCAYNGDKEKMRSKIFEEAAEYGFQYAIEKGWKLIEKLCDSHNIVSIKDGKYKSRSWLEEQFRKAMNE
jgi:hypothetical protein